MGRRPTIDREKLLDDASDIVRRQGAQALTMDALARAAGISKGGIQYAFVSKGELLSALVSRWISKLDGQMQGVDPSSTPIDYVRKYLEAARSSSGLNEAKTVALMITCAQGPNNLVATRETYRAILAHLCEDTADARKARIALLAIEGAHHLRMLGGSGSQSGNLLLDDIERFLEEPARELTRSKANTSTHDGTSMTRR